MATAAIAIPEFTVPTVRRVSYVLPNVERPPCYFAVPPASSADRKADYQRMGPLIIPHADVRTHASAPTDGSSDDVSRRATSSTRLRHSLPVSSLAIDSSTQLQDAASHPPSGILYAGGRDGVISAWDLNLPLQRRRKRRRRRSRSHLGSLGEYDEEATADLLDDFTLDDGLHGRPFPGGSEAAWEVAQTEKVGNATFRQCIGSHTDWVNEVLLCNANQTVVSASSDGCVNIWNPHDPCASLTPQVLGTHKDYVRALCHAPHANWIASGSLDKTIKLWDIKEARHDPIVVLPEAVVRSSVYTIATNAAGTVMAGGSPERVVRVWDPRTGRQVSQLIGHSDTVRKVIVSQDGGHLLSASADSTVKLWSLTEQRCLHTFTHHASSVWTLFSDHPQLDIFYSGDRTGLMCKVDWERCNEVSEGECVVLAKERQSATQANFRSDASASGINAIVALDNAFVWTASAGGRVSRWRDVPSRAAREALYPILSAAAPHGHHTSDEAANAVSKHVSNPRVQALRGTPATIATSFSSSPSTAAAVAASPPAHRSMASADDQPSSEPVTPGGTLFGIPFDSLVCLAPPNDPYGAAIGLGSVSMRATSRGATQGEMDTMFSSASLVSIPSVLQQHGLGELDRASPSLNAMPHLSYAASPPPLSPFVAAGGQLRRLSGTAARPMSVRSGSLRFAPADTLHPYEAHASQDSAIRRGPDSDDGKSCDEDLIKADDDKDDDDEGDDVTLEARMAFEERELALDAKPLRVAPEDVILSSHGLIRSSLLNDRRHCLTVDSDGSICLWDLVAGRCLGAYHWQETVDAARASGMTGELLPGEALDVIKERIQGYGCAPIWCTVDTKIGSLCVQLEHPRCFDAEVYLDECEDAFRNADPHFAYRDDQRVNIARLLLRNLFAGFVQREKQLRLGKGAPLPLGMLAYERKDALERLQTPSVRDRRSQSGTAGMRIAIAIPPRSLAVVPVENPLSPTNTHLQSDLQRFIAKQRSNVSKSDREGSNGGGSNDYFSLQRALDQSDSTATTPLGSKTTTGITSPLSPGGSGFMGRLRLGLRRDGTLSKKAGVKTPGAITTTSAQMGKAGSRTSPTGSTDDRGDETTSNDEIRQQLHALRTLLTGFASSRPSADAAPAADATSSSGSEALARRIAEDMPAIGFLPQTALIISESTHESSAFQVNYRGLVGSTQDDLATLELQAPAWLLEQLLGNGETAAMARQREKDKLTFLLSPWTLHETETEMAERRPNGSQYTATMPVMPSGNSRLTATHMLRIKKACAYVADKLHLFDNVDNDDGQRGGVEGRESGFSSIVASRRASAVAQDLHTTATTATAANGQLLASATHALTHANNKVKQSLPSPPASLMPLRRPSAGSARTASGTVSPLVMPPHSAAHDYIELLCRDEVVPPLMTLAQIQRFLWKSGSPIRLEYRWRADVEREE